MLSQKRSESPNVANSEQWSDEDFRLAVDVANQYYVDNKSKVDIADAVGLTRFQVGRIPQEAVRSGVVRIEIGLPGKADDTLSTQLQQALGIERAVVVNASVDSYAMAVEQVGAALAEVLSEEVVEGSTLGLAWSRTLDSMSRKLTQLRPCTVVQLAGHLHVPGADSGSVEIVRQTAAVSGGHAHPIYAPMIVHDAATARSLRTLPEVANTLAHAARVDLAVASIGAWQPGTSQLFDAVPRESADQARARGAVGEVAGRLFDAAGRPVNCDVDDRVIAVTLDNLRDASPVILSGFGDYRAQATRGALRATGAQVLVADTTLARALIEEASASTQAPG
ncbi:sugar-binding transcriptional regulator [Microbacterium sp. AK031]|uniref:sugar-binding transcriptional regulator n=1 Tax=Microbacterium sp. AK031 TaxID=2723076 RepID=UPI00216AABFA|nr:sugar-binding domain-containing protein [Microbacterium sp. AK031]MCS3844096.1 DNA-binding transcriptional regulator LsrR (DeoR family) [Microbacterium sp. AK031]